MPGAKGDRIRHRLFAGSIFAVGLCLALAAPAAGTGPFSCVGLRHEPVSCRICLVPTDGHGPTLCDRSGKAIETTAGTYSLRANAGDFGLGTNVEVEVGAGSSLSGSTQELRLVPGGRLRIATSERSDLSAVRIVSFATGRIETLRVGSEREVWIPSGAAVACGVTRDGTVAGLTRPWIQETGETVTMPPFEDPKPGRGHVFVRSRAPEAGEVGDAPLALTLLQGDHSQAASKSSTPGVAPIAAFYDVPVGVYDLSLDSDRWLLDGRLKVAVREGRVVIEDHVALVARPSLEIAVAPVPWKPIDGWSVTLYGCPADVIDRSGPAGWPDLDGCRRARTAQFRTDSATLAHLDPGRAFAVVEGDGRKIGQPVELIPGRAAKATFEFRSTRVFGVLTRAGSPIEGSISIEAIHPKAAAVEVATDANGRFERAFWSRGLFRVMAVATGQAPGRGRFFELELDGEAQHELNMELGTTDATVRVLDAETGNPIPSARVTWIDSLSSQGGVTDDSGELALPPLPAGETKIGIRAEGYKPGTRTITIADTEEPQSFDVSLLRQRDENSFLVFLPDGSPAAGAQVFVVGGANVIAETSSCDATGTCRLAAHPSDVQPIFGFAPGAGLTVVSGGDLFVSGRMTLRPAGGDLVVQPRRGSANARSTLELALVLDGAPIPEPLLGNLANRLERSYQIFAFPGALDRFEIVGLPLGPIGIEVLTRPEKAAETVPFAPAAESRVIELPTAGPEVVDLP
jgi:Carboxypeptidase regulatory-like domain